LIPCYRPLRRQVVDFNACHIEETTPDKPWLSLQNEATYEPWPAKWKESRRAPRMVWRFISIHT
jgi:hypothetical protein